MSQCAVTFRRVGCQCSVLYCTRNAGHDGDHHVSTAPCEDAGCVTEERVMPTKHKSRRTPRRLPHGDPK